MAIYMTKLKLWIYSILENLNLTKAVAIVLLHFEVPHPLAKTCASRDSLWIMWMWDKHPNNAKLRWARRHRTIPTIFPEQIHSHSRTCCVQLTIPGKLTVYSGLREVICCLLYYVYYVIQTWKHFFLIKIVDCKFILKLVRLFRFHYFIVLDFTPFSTALLGM